MRAEAFSTVVGGTYAEAVEYRSNRSRGIALHGERLTLWVDVGGHREAVLDLLLDKHDAGLVYEVLKRIDGAQFGMLFDVIANAEICIGADGRARFCDEGFDYVAELLGA